MKNIYLSLSVSFCIVLGSCCKDNETEKPTVNDSEANIQLFQQELLLQVNYARMQPAHYAEKHLKEFYETTNDDGTRRDNGAYEDLKSRGRIKSLELNDTLTLVASKYAEFLAKNNVIGHYEDDTPIQRAIRENYDHYLCENIMAGFYPSSDKLNAEIHPYEAAVMVVRSLIIDQGNPKLGHRKNIFRPEAREMGIGFYRRESSDKVNYFVQDFGR